MVHQRKRRNARKKEEPKNSRCKSADSGVSCTLTKSVLQQQLVQPSKYDINDPEEDRLDFEPEFADDELTEEVENKSELLINSDQSTERIFETDNSQDADSFCNTTIENSVSNISIAHRREMLPVPRSNAGDDRENDYLPLMYSSRTLIDSSSDDLSYGSEDHYETEGHGDIFDYSYNLDKTENESVFNMTQEEEDRLLGSSGDESQGELILQPKVVDTCHIGNARITIPKFVNVQEEKLRTKDLKRTNAVAKLKMFHKKNKKKKWDLRFTPEYPHTRVFLNDIGYIALNSLSDVDSSVSLGVSGSISSESVPPVRKLIVFGNENKIVCEESRSSIFSGKTSDSNFKLPLPPPKRPPTRPKRTVCNSNESGKSLQIKVSNKDPETPAPINMKTVPENFRYPEFSKRILNNSENDDTISILASTIDAENHEEHVTRTSQLEVGESQEMSSFNLPRSGRKEIELASSGYDPERVKAWVENVSILKIPESASSETQGSSVQNSNISSVMHPAVAAKGVQRVLFKDIPMLFQGLCYHYYFNGSCVKFNRCYLGHTICKDKFASRFQKNTPENLHKAFLYALKFNKIFNEIYPCFIIAFGKLKMRKELVASIKHFLTTKDIKSTDALELIVKALEDTDLSFLDTIETISLNVGFLDYPELADILLEIMSRRENISENWEVMKRMAKARGCMSPAIAQRILIKVTSVYPLNKDLCLDIYNFVMKNNITDMSKIDEEALAPFRTLAGFGEQHNSMQTQNVIHKTTPVDPATESLAAHIDTNLVRERQLYEREVRRNAFENNAPAWEQDSYNRNCFGEQVNSYDTDERCRPDNRWIQAQSCNFPIRSLVNVGFNNEFTTPPRFSKQESNSSNSSHGPSTSSQSSSLHFVPPSHIEYVAQGVPRNDPLIRNDSPLTTTQIPVFEPSIPPPVIVGSDHQSLPPLLQEAATSLMPLRPIFGNPQYRKDFQFNKSLHNLLPNIHENVGINENDILPLNNVIKSKNGSEYYKLLRYYKGPVTIQNFITMTIAHLKSIKNRFETIIGLVQSLVHDNPDCVKDVYVKAVFEIVIMNLLFVLERKGEWIHARRLLEMFCDWDSLISSYLFQIFSNRNVTQMGRYIFFAKVFAMGHNFHLTYEILQCPTLRLLASCDTWPYNYFCPVDVDNRNTVLTEFFKVGYHFNIIDVADMYKRIYKYGQIHGYDAYIHFNPMLVQLINDQKTSFLKHFYSDIDIYYKLMEKNVLRAFTIMLADHLSRPELFRLYGLCCERQIYTNYNVGEMEITVRNNMLNAELQLILNYYFYKMSQMRRLPSGDVSIHIKLMEKQVTYPKMLQKCVRSMKEINETLKKILRDSFGIVVSDATNRKDAVIEISLNQLELWLGNQRLSDVYCYGSS